MVRTYFFVFNRFSHKVPTFLRLYLSMFIIYFLFTACVCSEHFLPECFEVPLRQRLLNYSTKNTRILKDGALPTLRLPLKTLDSSQFSQRSERMAKRKRTKEVDEILASAQQPTSTAVCEEIPREDIENSVELFMDTSNLNGM